MLDVRRIKEKYYVLIYEYLLSIEHTISFTLGRYLVTFYCFVKLYWPIKGEYRSYSNEPHSINYYHLLNSYAGNRIRNFKQYKIITASIPTKSYLLRV